MYNDLSRPGKKKKIVLGEAGTLFQYIRGEEKFISELKIIGPINGSDLRLLRKMAGRIDQKRSDGYNLNILDLSEAQIVAGGESYYKDKKSNSNVLGANAFYACDNLQSIILPNNLIKIEPSSLSNCSNLKSIQINISNPNYKSLGDVLYSKNGKILVQYPNGKKLETFSIPNSVAKIEEEAFLGCWELKSVIIPSSVNQIGRGAFANCGEVTSISLSPNISRIEDGTFMGCEKLEGIQIPSIVTSIGESAFEECNKLKTIVIPSSVMSIGKSAFLSCHELGSIIVQSGNQQYFSDDGVLILKNANSLLCYPSGKRYAVYSIPDYITRIDERAFYYNEWIRKITIPNSVISIGDYAFVGCKNLTTIFVPETVKSIGEDIFMFCDNLSSNPIPKELLFADGKYYGSVLNNTMNGKGKFIYNSGNVYDGEWVNGKMHGQGKFVWKNGTYYQGDFKNGFFEGRGQMKYSDNYFYNGDWKNDKRNGLGVLICPDGSYYEANFSNDEFHGYGRYFDKNRELVYEGVWENGKLIQKIGGSNNQSQISNNDDEILKGLLIGSMVTLGYLIGKEIFDSSSSVESEKESDNNSSSNYSGSSTRTYSSSSSQSGNGSSSNKGSWNKTISAAECYELSEKKIGDTDLFGTKEDDYYIVHCRSEDSDVKLYIQSDERFKPYYIRKGMYGSLDPSHRYDSIEEALKYIARNYCDCWLNE